MAQFNWENTPAFGTCLACGTSANARGFVNTHADVALRRNEYEISGYADVIFCGDCLLQMGRLVGMATPQETEDFARRELELVEANEKLADEVQAWSQRFDTIMDQSFVDSVKAVVAERPVTKEK